jgi:hypothetical protein
MSQAPFLKLLEQFCHINDIAWTEQRKRAGEAVITHPERGIVSGARKGYILSVFQRLVRGEIDEEVFFGTGEIWWSESVGIPAWGNEVNGWLLMQEQLQNPDYPVSMVVVDDVITLLTPQSTDLLRQAEAKGLVVVEML